jgi:hypothetical protein
MARLELSLETKTGCLEVEAIFAGTDRSLGPERRESGRGVQKIEKHIQASEPLILSLLPAGKREAARIPSQTHALTL